MDFKEMPDEPDYTTWWQTRDGDFIKYADMTDSHLINAHNMMERKVCNFLNRCMNRNEELDLPEWDRDKINGLEEEMIKRGLLEQTKGGDNE